MAGPDDWWKAAPVVEEGNWWESAPLVEAKGSGAADRIAAAKAGTLTVDPARAAKQAEIDAAAEAGMRDPGAVGALLAGATQGATFGFGDEFLGGVAANAGLVKDALTGNWSGIVGRHGERYAGMRDEVRNMLDDARASRPWTTGGAEVAGSVIPALAGVGAVGQAGTLGGKIGMGALAGGASGAAYGFGSAEGGAGERVRNALAGGVGGMAIGGAIPAAAHLGRKGLEALANSRAAQKAVAAAPSMDDLRAAASRIYGQADQVTNLPRADFATKATGMLDDAARSGMDDMLTPGAARVAGKIDDAAQAVDPNISFRELDILRKQAGIPAGNVANRTEAAIGSKMVEGIDAYVDAVDPALSGAIREARDMWGVLRRSDLVDKAIEKAKNTASGFENGLRIEFRKILNNPKLMRGFSEAERKALQRVVQGSPAGNLMRQIGRVGLGISGQSNGLGASIGGIAGTALGGPIAGLATVASGTAMKALAERSTRKAAQNALATVGARNALSGVPQAALPGIENALGLIGFSGLPQAAGQVGNALLGR